jgi:hypothetical protein
MKVLHILKSRPDESTDLLMDSVSEGKEAARFELFAEDADYEKLIDLVFEHDQVISWW